MKRAAAYVGLAGDRPAVTGQRSPVSGGWPVGPLGPVAYLPQIFRYAWR